MKKLYMVLGAVAVLAIGGVAYSVGSNALGTAATEPIDVEGLDNTERLVELAQGMTKGDPNAPITIIEFGDYQCPACGSFATSVKPQIELAMVESGEAKFVFYDFPLVQVHPHAFLAARAARCAADQDKFWDYHELLFRSQPSWSGEANAIGSFMDYASSVGMDEAAFESCLKSDRHADVVTANMYLGAQLGVGGTPTILVNSNGQVRRVNNNDFASILETVEALQAGVGPSGN